MLVGPVGLCSGYLSVSSPYKPRYLPTSKYLDMYLHTCNSLLCTLRIVINADYPGWFFVPPVLSLEILCPESRHNTDYGVDCAESTTSTFRSRLRLGVHTVRSSLQCRYSADSGCGPLEAGMGKVRHKQQRKGSGIICTDMTELPICGVVVRRVSCQSTSEF